MVAKDYKRTKGGSGKAEVGEVDTSAPFQSVKDAITLFGEGAFSGVKPIVKRPEGQSAERVLAKETQLHLAVKELNKLRDQLKNAEITKGQALIELEKAKNTIEHLNEKIKVTNDSKNQGIRDNEIAREQARKFTEKRSNGFEGTDSFSKDVETQGVQYVATMAELHAAKQELGTCRLEYGASLKTKAIAEKQALEADNAVKENMGRIDEISKEISSVNDTIEYIKLAAVKAKEDEIAACAEKEEEKKMQKVKLQELETKLLVLKKDTDPEKIKSLETQLNEASLEIKSLVNELEVARALDRDSFDTMNKELDGAKESLSKMAEEERSLRSLVDTLKSELEGLRKEHAESKEKEVEIESAAGNLHLMLLKAKSELGESLAEEVKVKMASDELLASLRVLALENENAKREANEMKKKAEEMKLEAETRKNELEEAESRLRAKESEAEEAKGSEARALDQIKKLSEKTIAERPPASKHGTQITISRDEFESLSRKVEDSEKLAELKVAAAMAQVEAVKASENEALKRLETMKKEIEDMKTTTEEALKKAEMGEAARRAIEGELRRWREQEQKKQAELASRILAETETPLELSPYSYQLRSQQKTMETRKLENSKSYKKKTKLEGSSLSYLPGEKPLW